VSFFHRSKPEKEPEPTARIQENREDQLRAVRANPFFGESLLEECDRLPGADGAFGTSASNPIPVNGPRGERTYLNSLRSARGAVLIYHRIGSFESALTDRMVDVFEVLAEDLSYWAYLAFSPYHPRRSVEVPEGLNQVDWPSDPDKQLMAALAGLGVMGFIEQFPQDIPAALRGDPTLALDFQGEKVHLGHLLAASFQPRLDRLVEHLPERHPIPEFLSPAWPAPLEP
jgi:hypothetical protein